jgi:hypothetical protein
MKDMKTRLALMAAVLTLLAAWCAAPAMADDIQLICSTCYDGSVTQISTSTTVGFDFVGVGGQTFTGEGFIAVLVPNGFSYPTVSLTGPGVSLEETKLNFNSSDLGTFLGEDFSDYNFSTFASATGQLGITATTFTVYEYALGEITLGPNGAGVTGFSVTAPIGSVVAGWLECDSDVKCNGTDGGTLQTPMSSNITIPEPSTLGMLGFGVVGLLGLAVVRRRPFIENV